MKTLYVMLLFLALPSIVNAAMPGLYPVVGSASGPQVSLSLMGQGAAPVGHILLAGLGLFSLVLSAGPQTRPRV